MMWRSHRAYRFLPNVQQSWRVWAPWTLAVAVHSDAPRKKGKLAPLQERKMVDRFRLWVKGGQGGDGCTSYQRSRHARHATPDGGNGGKGGNVILESSAALWDFSNLHHHVEDIAEEAETGKTYRASYLDKYGRSVLVLRPGCQNTTSTKGQIKFLVYCMENAIINLPPGQEQLVWLIDFKGWNISNVSLKVACETAHVLQDRYPERLGLAILYNPPKIFESFWLVVKPFLEEKTYKKVKFVYSKDPESIKLMEELFNMDELECTFGGKNPVQFSKDEYAK